MNCATKGFEYKGVIVSACDKGIGSYKPADKPMYYTANNHGSMEKIGDDWYIFYHRHTNGTNYSRQGCFEKLRFNEDGTIRQAEITSCGSVRPLKGEGYYSAYQHPHQGIRHRENGDPHGVGRGDARQHSDRLCQCVA